MRLKPLLDIILSVGGNLFVAVEICVVDHCEKLDVLPGNGIEREQRMVDRSECAVGDEHYG